MEVEGDPGHGRKVTFIKWAAVNCPKPLKSCFYFTEQHA